ncbi:MAG: hypothetical protein AAGM22_00375 [Acidobacteriota bacterium]
MTAYIARSGAAKKKNIFRQRVLELRGEIGREGPAHRLRRGAERLRTARLNVIRALLAESRPVREEDEAAFAATAANLERERQLWEIVPVEEIIQIYAETTEELPRIDRKRW